MSIPVTGKMSDYHICFLCFEIDMGRAELTAYVDDVKHPVTIEYDKEALPVDLQLQILGGYNKLNEMADYPHGCGVVDVDSCVVTQPNTENVIDDLRIWLYDDDLSVYQIKEFLEENLPEETFPAVPYLEWEDGRLSSTMLPSNSYKRVTVFTETLSDGWYIVDDEIVINHTLTVDGHAKLILCDGASLTVNGGGYHAGIEVCGHENPFALVNDDEITIYGQAGGTGRLTVKGGESSAGIGGDVENGTCGKVTINGGTVTATGGWQGAGIGGGNGGSGGTVTINGGTVTATGGAKAAGIGGGDGGAGGTVTINGGRPNVNAGSGATSVIGPGFEGWRQETMVAITGGLFSWMPDENWLKDGSQIFVNHDPLTCADYPWTVFSAACVTFERVLAHTTAVWTSGDGSVKTPISGKSFFVPKGTTGVKVIFASESPYAYVIDKTEYAFSGAVNADCVIPAKDLPTAQATACPDGYVRLDYIESTAGGGQYIDTGIKSSPTLAATMDYMAFEHTGHVNLGTVNSGDANWRYFDYEGGPLFDCVGARAGETYGNTLVLNTRYVANVGSQGDHIYLTVTDAGTREEIKSFTSAYNGTLNPANVFVFGGWSSGSIVCTPMRLYSLTLRDFKNAGDAERTILAEFVPCYRESDVAIGLYDLVSGRFMKNAGTSKFVPPENMPGIPYLEWKDGRLAPAELPFGSYEFVMPETRTLSDGWYVVKDAVSISNAHLTVNGHAKLLLCDGTSLTVNGERYHAGIDVLPGNALSIFGQANGTGRLETEGSECAAGLGSPGMCGTITINGGTVTATGGKQGAGIGGGVFCAGGTVTINGGTVTALGGWHGAGIGGGDGGADGDVTINGGRLKVMAGEGASVIGAGRDGNSQGTVAITGGIFAWKPNDEWLAETNLKFINNLNP